MVAGRATPEGTRRFAERAGAAPGHFREGLGLSLASIGLGTYLGEEDAETDAGYEGVVGAALDAGINVFDTAINYRGQKSERAIGRALAGAFDAGRAARDEVFVATKGGYLPHDAEEPRSPRQYVLESFVQSGLAPPDEIARGSHCMAPAYLRDQIERSRANLGLDTIDLYYLHNVETQFGAVDAATFRARLTKAIELLEEEAEAGRIGAWGLATWDGLRVPPEHPQHLSILEVLGLAERVAGERHHFRAVQLPSSLGMPHAAAYRSQETGRGRMAALEAARALGLGTFGSASILQGSLAGAELPENVAAAFPEASTSAQRALQFARSVPGITTALVGVSSLEHAAEDFALARVPPAEPERAMSVFGRARG
jgi:aryl-alcohol dehydrogenase-like predicted oxidoreductase